MDLEPEIKRLCDIERITGYDVHRYLRHGHLEKVYERSLCNRLRAQGLQVESQFALPVYDEDGSLLGDFYANLFVEGKIIVELKACNIINNAHIAQILGYLRTSRVEHGLLLNFGAPKFYIKKFILTPI